MTTTAINLPLYRVLRALQVSEPDATAAAEATMPDLSQLATKDDLTRCATRDDVARCATKDELRAEIAGVRTEIAQTARRQTTSLTTVAIAAAGVVIAAQRLLPPVLPTDAVRAIVEQTVRNLQPPPAPSPRSAPQP